MQHRVGLCGSCVEHWVGLCGSPGEVPRPLTPPSLSGSIARRKPVYGAPGRVYVGGESATNAEP